MIAIDPGAKGGIAWPEGCQSMPDTNGGTLSLLRTLRAQYDTCYIEHVVGFIPGGGKGSMFTFGENFGFLQGVLAALDYRVVRVRPQTWQKALQLGGKPPKVKVDKDASKESRKSATALNSAADREWKNKLKSEAERRFPTMKVTLSTADALLIMVYARSDRTVF